MLKILKFNEWQREAEYAGTEFRSKLEAAWAALFDAKGWAWEYEPEAVNGWTPDFLLAIGAGKYLVEVKYYAPKGKHWREARARFDRVGLPGVVILGEGLRYESPAPMAALEALTRAEWAAAQDVSGWGEPRLTGAEVKSRRYLAFLDSGMGHEAAKAAAGYKA
jgi:hypothetical protein